MPLHITGNNNGNILELHASGKLIPADFKGLESTFQAMSAKYGKIRVLFRMQDFHGWDALAFWDEVKFDFKYFGDIERLAMVGDKEWEKVLAVSGHLFTTAEIRYFDTDSLSAAQRWIGLD